MDDMGDNVRAQHSVRPPPRPLLGLAAVFLAGTCAGIGGNGAALPDCFFAVALMGLAAGLLHCLACAPPSWTVRAGPAFDWAASAATYGALFLAGCISAALSVHPVSGCDLARLMERPREGIEIIGRVASDPELRQARGAQPGRWSFLLSAEAVSRIGYFEAARGLVAVAMPAGGNSPAYGERWRLSGSLADLRRLRAEDAPPGVRDVAVRRFFFRVADSGGGGARAARLSDAPRFSVLGWCWKLRKKCACILSRGIGGRPDVVAILHAILLGRQSELPVRLRDAFTATGTYHIFAISGQHIAILALFAVAVLQFYRVGRMNWFYWLAPVLGIFTIMTGLSASAVRGCLMALVCFLGLVFMRRPDIPSAMALAAIVIVGFDPSQLFRAGFILSFGIVTGLIVLCPPLAEAVDRRLAPDPMRIEREMSAARKAARWFLYMLVASWAAWLVSTPLIARWFSLVSPVALPANMLIVPLATFVLFFGCLSIITGFILPAAAAVFNTLNAALVWLMAESALALARLPGGHFFVKPPPLWLIFGWFIILIAWRFNRRRRGAWVVAGAALAAVSLVSSLVQASPWEAHVLNTGNGAVCLMCRAGMPPLMVNTVPAHRADSTVAYLRAQGVNRLGVLLLPETDPDRAGAAEALAAAFKPVSVYARPGRKDRQLAAPVDALEGAFWRARPGNGKWRVDACGADSIPPVETAPAGEIVVSADGHGGLRIIPTGRGDAFAIEVAGNCAPSPVLTRGARIIRCVPLTLGVSSEDPMAVALGPGQGILLKPGKGGTRMTPFRLWR